jgi:hypothetical protein
VANGLLFVTASSGQLFVLNAANGDLVFSDQALDLNEAFDLGLAKPHHASMNGGTIISHGMVYVPYGAQNNPSGGVIAYALNRAPFAAGDVARVVNDRPVVVDALANDGDPDGDALQFVNVAGREIYLDDASADLVDLGFGTVEVFNRGDDPSSPEAAYLRFIPNERFRTGHRFSYQVADMAPRRVVNGVELDEPEPTHTPRRAGALVSLVKARSRPSCFPRPRTCRASIWCPNTIT